MPKIPVEYGPEYVLHHFYRPLPVYTNKIDYQNDLAIMLEFQSLSGGYYKYIRPNSQRVQVFKDALIRYRNAENLKLGYIERDNNTQNYYSALCAVVDLIKVNFPYVSLPTSIPNQYEKKPLNGFIELLLHSYGYPADTLFHTDEMEYNDIEQNKDFNYDFHDESVKTNTADEIKALNKSMDTMISEARDEIIKNINKNIEIPENTKNEKKDSYSYNVYEEFCKIFDRFFERSYGSFKIAEMRQRAISDNIEIDIAEEENVKTNQNDVTYSDEILDVISQELLLFQTEQWQANVNIKRNDNNKHFFITNPPHIITHIFGIYNFINPSNRKLIKKFLLFEKETYKNDDGNNVEAFFVDFSSIIDEREFLILNFDNNIHCVHINAGYCTQEVFKISKKPSVIKNSFSNSIHEKYNEMIKKKDFPYIIDGERNFIIMDAQTGKMVEPIIFYDEEDKKLKSKILLKPEVSYFVSELDNYDNENELAETLSDYDFGMG